MKVHSWHLIISSIILFLLNFLILANKTISPGHEIEGISTVIAFVCALVFVAGIVWAIFEPISKRIKSHPAAAAAAPQTMVSEKSRLALSTLEIVFNRLFAVLLVLSTVPFLKNILAPPTIVIFIVFACFLWFGKKYRLFTNIIFFIFALGVYFIFLPIGWGLYHSLKEIRLGDFNFYTLSAIFSLAPLIFVTFAVRNVLGNILAYFKTSPASRNAYYLISLFIVLATLLAYPFFDSVRVRERAFEDDSGDNNLSFILTKQELKHDGGSTSYSRDYTARYDPVSNKYVYRLYLEDPLAESITFTTVKTDGEKINFITDGRVNCLNCQKDKSDPFGLIFPAGKNIDFIITNDQLIKNIKFTETGDKVADFSFWK